MHTDHTWGVWIRRMLNEQHMKYYHLIWIRPIFGNNFFGNNFFEIEVTLTGNYNQCRTYWQNDANSSSCHANDISFATWKYHCLKANDIFTQPLYYQEYWFHMGGPFVTLPLISTDSTCYSLYEITLTTTLIWHNIIIEVWAHNSHC